MLNKYVEIISETGRREQYQKCVPAQQLQLVERAILGGLDLAKTLVEIEGLTLKQSYDCSDDV